MCEHVAVVGSREWRDVKAVRDAVDALENGTVVVSGGARGVDSIAVEWALRRGLQVLVFNADWKRFGKSAGYRRNQTIVANCDRVLAFWDGRSPGTRHAIDIARNAGKPIKVIKEAADGVAE